ncbi:GNAT family N-acetyltransferase [Bacillus gobiensis]|uniref:GNAT family N-acetyltransferase n=1 Tax=Bacillus gobiensis TaxID=1441095 RepID=UPI003D2437D9
MITIKLLSECPLSDAVSAWNKGFEDYFSSSQMTVEQFTHRLGKEDLSPSYSFVAYCEEEPVGLILNGIKMMNGKKWAWNGGTSVAPSHRKSGVASKLMKESMDVYEREGVEIASLEAFSVNEKAIRLYEKYGYKIIDHLLFLELKGRRKEDLFQDANKNAYSIEYGLPKDIGKLKLYNDSVPWQTQWQHIRDGESLVVKDSSENVLGYALYRRVFNGEGNLQSIILYQCECDRHIHNKEEVLKYMINYVFQANESIHRMTYNLPESNHSLVDILQEAGFKKAYTPNGTLLEQVFMKSKK